MAEHDLTVAIVQMAMSGDRQDNIARACQWIRRAALQGAQVVLLPELFEGPYFPRTIDNAHFVLATSVNENPAIKAMTTLCSELKVVVPVSFFERDGESYYNSVVMIDADGSVLGRYRKTHIPDGAGYEEKHYFSAGDSGFVVFDTHYGRIGVGICWDQWFPECARALTLLGAEVLLYPTAIGSEPLPPHRDTRAPWRRVMQGHAVANTIPVAAANRVGEEEGQRFYGTSFVCDGYGEVCAELDDQEEGFVMVEFRRDKLAQERDWMGLLRDRRPECYGALVKA